MDLDQHCDFREVTIKLKCMERLSPRMRRRLTRRRSPGMCLREAMAMKIRLTVQVVELQLTSARRRSTRAHNLTIRAMLRPMAEENHATMRSLMAKISTAGASSRIMVIGSRSRLMVKTRKPRSTVGSMESSSR